MDINCANRILGKTKKYNVNTRSSTLTLPAYAVTGGERGAAHLHG